MVYITEVNNEVVDEIKKAVENNRFRYFYYEGKQVGFATWWVRGQDIFINNTYVEPEYRGKIKLLSLLKDFIKNNPIKGKYYWHNNRRNKIYERKCT